MTSYEPPRRTSYTRPYDGNPAYNGQPPQVHVQPAQQYAPPPPQHQQPFQRARGSSNASQRSTYAPPQHTQQQQPLIPYAQAPAAQPDYQASPHQDLYLPHAPQGPYPPDQLHPAQAYHQSDPFQYRQRTPSTSSAASRRSHRSSHSHHSHASSPGAGRKEHLSGRKDGERATLGDSLYGMWGAVKAMIPVRR